MSQIAALKKHFTVPGARLTAFDALRKFGVARLAARINEMAADGYVFDRQMVSVNLGQAKVADYVLRCTPAMTKAAAQRAGEAMAVA